MSIEFDATYRAEAIVPDQPLALQENLPVRVVVVEKDTAAPSDATRGVSLKGLTREQIIALRPKAPRFTAEQLDAIVEEYSVSVGTLPPDFSREDIYSDHD